MLDRAYSFSENDIVEMIRKETIPVALDVWYASRRRDAAGSFYRHVVYQRPELEPGRTQQGFYVFSPDGTLFEGWNNRSLRRLRERLRSGLSKHELHQRQPLTAWSEELDANYTRKPPPGAVVLETYARVTDGTWAKEPAHLAELRRYATGRDHAWVLEDEIELLGRGKWPERLGRRLARFHLVDNTRGEPPMWKPREVRAIDFRMEAGPDGVWVITGTVALRTRDRSRGFEAAIRGEVVVNDGVLERCNLLVRGEHWGQGAFVHDAPEGRSRLEIAIRKAERNYAGHVPPQASRDLKPYLRAR